MIIPDRCALVFPCPNPPICSWTLESRWRKIYFCELWDERPSFCTKGNFVIAKSQSSFGSACELRTGKCTKNKTNMYRATSWAEEPLICLFSDLVELLAKITSESASQRCSGKKNEPYKIGRKRWFTSLGRRQSEMAQRHPSKRSPLRC